MKEKAKKMTPAMAFIVLLGIVSLFSDMTHEGAASIRGAYLSLLGASAATIGFVSGLGELVGYSLRIVFGRLTDKTRKYWTLTIIGYAVDVLAVPALALVHRDGWIFACLLLILERTGKAIKKPAKNTILSFAASSQGVGKSFAIQEALDQIGAFLGPVMLYLVMLVKKDADTFDKYRLCFVFLIIPALLTMAFLLYSKRKFPNPENFEPETKESAPFRLEKRFILYIAAISLFAFGFIDFSLITMHVSNSGLIADDTLPLLYAGAMIVDAFSALIFGRAYDKYGFKTLMVSTAVSSCFSLFVFGFNSVGMTVAGVLLWGVGMGAQESILKAAVSQMIPKKNRAAGYGIFECAFGFFWFLGSWALGALYDVSLTALIIASVAAELAAIPLYYLSSKNSGEKRAAEEKTV